MVAECYHLTVGPATSFQHVAGSCRVPLSGRTSALGWAPPSFAWRLILSPQLGERLAPCSRQWKGPRCQFPEEGISRLHAFPGGQFVTSALGEKMLSGERADTAKSGTAKRSTVGSREANVESALHSDLQALNDCKETNSKAPSRGANRMQAEDTAVEIVSVGGTSAVQALSDTVSLLPWAVDPRAQTHTAIDARKGATSKQARGRHPPLQGNADGRTGRLQLSGGMAKGRPPGLSARQRLLALDLERGENIPTRSETPSRRPDARRFQRGFKQEWKDEARLAKRAVEAILSSQALEGLVRVMRPATPAVSEGPIETGPEVWCFEDVLGGSGEGGIGVGVNRVSEDKQRVLEGGILQGAESGDPNLGMPRAEGGSQGERTLNQNALRKPEGLVLEQAVPEAKERQAALARTLEGLAGSLSLFRWQDILKDLGDRGHWAVALDVFKWMQANLRLKPNAFTYGQMVSCFNLLPGHKAVVLVTILRLNHVSCTSVLSEEEVRLQATLL
jgi:hypothetical protein